MEGPIIYTKCKLTWGGDWEWVAKVLGLTGPNGFHFCPHCLSTLNDLERGKPHALHVLEEYQDEDEDAGVPASFQLRDLATCHAKAQEFIAKGAKKEQAKLFDNCIQLPLMGAAGQVIEHVSQSLAYWIRAGVANV